MGLGSWSPPALGLGLGTIGSSSFQTFEFRQECLPAILGLWFAKLQVLGLLSLPRHRSQLLRINVQAFAFLENPDTSGHPTWIPSRVSMLQACPAPPEKTLLRDQHPVAMEADETAQNLESDGSCGRDAGQLAAKDGLPKETFSVSAVDLQSLSPVRLFANPWTAARQAPLLSTNSCSLLKLVSTESVMPCNHLILCRPLLFLPSIFPSIRIFSNESALQIRWPKY